VLSDCVLLLDTSSTKTYSSSTHYLVSVIIICLDLESFALSVDFAALYKLRAKKKLMSKRKIEKKINSY
jgi:hypothetical protein